VSGPYVHLLPLLLAALVAAGCESLGREPEPPPPEPPEPSLILRGTNVMTAAGPTLMGADVLVRRGKIAGVGKGLGAPAGARVVDLPGRWITPGLIDPHSHIGVYAQPSVWAHRDGNESSGPFKPEVRASEGFWPQDPAIRKAVAGGVTTIHVLPGSANLVGGEGVTLRLKPRATVKEMRFPGAPRTMKMACGENPKRVYGKRKKSAPVTRMGEIALLRQRLEEAKIYKKKRESEEGPPPPVDHAKAALADVLAGKVLIQNHCYRADEMRVRLDLFREFGIRPRAFHHATEAYKIADTLRDENVGAVVWADWGPVKMEMLDMVPANAALLEVAGARASLHSDSPMDVQHMNQEAAKALAAGERAGLDVDRERAIRWVTANPAWVLGIDGKTGTIEEGKDADLVVWSDDPFSVYSRAERVYIEGELVYDRSRPELFPVSDFELGLEQP
jgi:imidazolonepropionase-like amidohydrolase